MAANMLIAFMQANWDYTLSIWVLWMLYFLVIMPMINPLNEDYQGCVEWGCQLTAILVSVLGGVALILSSVGNLWARL